jgi:hypothetical protein
MASILGGEDAKTTGKALDASQAERAGIPGRWA